VGLRLGMSGVIPLLPLIAFFATQEQLYMHFFLVKFLLSWFGGAVQAVW